MKDKTELELAKAVNILQCKIDRNAELIRILSLDSQKAAKELKEATKEYKRRN